MDNSRFNTYTEGKTIVSTKLILQMYFETWLVMFQISKIRHVAVCC